MELVLDEGSSANGPPSPVLGPLKRLIANLDMLRQSSALFDNFRSLVTEETLAEIPTMPVRRGAARWMSLSRMIDWSMNVKRELDTVARQSMQLERLSEDDWVTIVQVGDLIRPFVRLANCVTLPHYLCYFSAAAYEQFYGEESNVELLPAVAALRSALRIDFGIRLHANSNDMSMVGLALHPT
jgi:hypothetical protein